MTGNNLHSSSQYISLTFSLLGKASLFESSQARAGLMMDDPIELIHHHSTPPTAAKADQLEHNQHKHTTDPVAATEPRSRVRLAAILLALSVRVLMILNTHRLISL